MQSDDPLYLTVGTEVSAKFKGAFCEAKIKKVYKALKVKVQLKDSPHGYKNLGDSEFPTAKFEPNEQTDVWFNNKLVPCVIAQLKDNSKYHVVFNDGDEKELRRTQLVLKGGKHFDADGNLDSMPLTNPELFFSTPVVRNAAKRGAQKIRKVMNEASGSRHTGNEVEEKEEDDDEEEEDEAEEVNKRREKRKAAHAAVAAIGELNQAQGPDTQSEESSADSSEEKERAKERRRRREGDKAGPSNAVSSEDDEPTSSGQNPENQAEAERISKDQKKRDEREHGKLQRKQEKDERQKMKEVEKEKRREERARLQKKKRREKLYKSAIDWSVEQHNKIVRIILTHHSEPFRLKLHQVRGKRRPVPRERHRIRNHTLVANWARLSAKADMKSTVRYFRQWWKRKTFVFDKTLRALKLMRNRERRDQIGRWLKGAEKMKKVQVVVIHENYSQARRILKFVDRGCLEKRTFADRCEISGEDIQSSTLYSHFERQEWYLAVLFPSVFTTPNGSRRRIVRHMSTGKLMQVWEDDLVPFDWLPAYDYDTMVSIVAKRPVDRKSNFELAWRFATDYVEKRIDLKVVKSRLDWNRKPAKSHVRVTEHSGIPTTVPSPTKRTEEDDGGLEDEEEEEVESDYDSDASIKNAPGETKDLFVGLLFQFHDTHNTSISSTPKIQDYDVDLFYFYELARRMGGARKVMAANAWTDIGKKLVPLAVEPEDELKKIFKTYLEAYLTMKMKLDWPMDRLEPRSERKTVRPGQYSEVRRRKSVTGQDGLTLSLENPAKKVVRGRKRKTSSEDVVDAKKKNRKSTSTRGSRATTLERSSAEPGPSHIGLLDESDSDDDEETKSKKSTSSSQLRRSVSVKTEETTPLAQVPPKKGRPRKNTMTSAVQRPKGKRAKRGEKNSWPGFINANVLSNISAGQKLAAFYHERWYSATAIEDVTDFTAELMEVMLAERVVDPQTHQLSQTSLDRLSEIYSKMKVRTHYTGWNQRYDEYMQLPKLMVTIKDQAEARRRFRRLPRGEELLPETIAFVEEFFRKKERIELADDGESITDLFTSDDYLRMAKEALNLTFEAEEVKSEVVEDDEDDYEEDGEKPKDRVNNEPHPSTSRGIDESDDDDEVQSMKSEEKEQRQSDGGIESESDEPEYPHVPSSPRFLTVSKSPPPHQGPLLESVSSVASSNHPIVSRQGSSNSAETSVPLVPSLFSPPNSLSHSGPLTLEEVQKPTVKDADEFGEPITKRLRNDVVDGITALLPPQFTSGALTLDILPESSGPIELPKKGGRKKAFQKPSPSIVTSGPLTLSMRPPGSSPIGRSKKNSHKADEMLDEEEDDGESITGRDEVVVVENGGRKESTATSRSTTPMTTDEREDEVSDKQGDEVHITPRGFGATVRGKRRRGGRFGGSYSTKAHKVAKKKDRDENGEEKEHDESLHSNNHTPSSAGHSTRADSFQTQKNRMAKIMEQEGTRKAFHLSDLPDFRHILADAPKEDLIMLLEERTNELREKYAICKADLSQLEKRYRQQNEAKRKAELVESELATNSSSSSSSTAKN